MGWEGFEPPTSWPPAKNYAVKNKSLQNHTKLDHHPIFNRD
ncbi:hypothetical protein ES703_64660 [subsurface metagenome]